MDDSRLQRDEWERQVEALWESFDGTAAGDFLATATALAAAGPRAEGLYELASAYDSTGDEAAAVRLYEQALTAGLGKDRRRQAVVQLASSFRNVGRADAAVRLLEAELDAESDELDDAVRAFLALALVDVGREVEAVATALEALTPHLPQYRRSVAAYAAELRSR